MDNEVLVNYEGVVIIDPYFVSIVQPYSTYCPANAPAGLSGHEPAVQTERLEYRRSP